MVQGLAHDGRDMLGPSEHVERIHLLRQIAHARDHRRAQQFLAGMARIDGNHPHPLQPQIPRDEIAGPHRIGRNTDHAHHPHPQQKPAQGVVIGGIGGFHSILLGHGKT
jgi:hypothetical protein